MTRDFVERGLVVSDRLEEYDGTTAVVRTTYLAAEEVEFMRWRAERWMKVRHMPAAFRHDPWFIARNARQMFATPSAARPGERGWDLKMSARRSRATRYCAARNGSTCPAPAAPVSAVA